MKKKINYFWIIYAVFIGLLFALFTCSCSTTQHPAEFRFKQETINKHKRL